MVRDQLGLEDVYIKTEDMSDDNYEAEDYLLVVKEEDKVASIKQEAENIQPPFFLDTQKPKVKAPKVRIYFTEQVFRTNVCNSGIGFDFILHEYLSLCIFNKMAHFCLLKGQLSE